MGDSSYIMIMLNIFVAFYVEQKHRLAWEKKSGPKILFYTKDLFSNEELWTEVLSIKFCVERKNTLSKKLIALENNNFFRSSGKTLKIIIICEPPGISIR